MNFSAYLTLNHSIFFIVTFGGFLTVLFIMKMAMVRGRPSKTAVFLVSFPCTIALSLIAATLLSVNLYPGGVILLIAFQAAIFSANRMKIFPKFPPPPAQPSTSPADMENGDPLTRTISES